MRYRLYHLPQLPDLSLPKYNYLSANNVSGVLKKHLDFLRYWHICLMQHRLSMHLCFMFHPERLQGERLGIYLLFLGPDEKALVSIDELLPFSPLADYFHFERIKTVPDNLKADLFSAGATLIKKERTVLFERQSTSVRKKFYSVSNWECNEDARMVDMVRVLIAIGQSSKKPCAFRIDVFPEQSAAEMHTTLDPTLRLINELTSSSSTSLMGVGVHQFRRELQLESLQKEYTTWLEHLDVNQHFRINIYAFADDVDHAAQILGAAGTEAIEKGNFDILPMRMPPNAGLFERVHSGEPRVYNRRINGKAMCDEAEQPGISKWSTTFLVEEAAVFFRLPVLYDGENIEMLRESTPPNTEKGLLIAKDTRGYSIRYAMKNLSKHALISGMPGSGKTNTMLHIISELNKSAVPFLVLEPAKKEYRALFNDRNVKNIFLFSPGTATSFPLHVNPFEFPLGLPLSEHIDFLMAVFSGTFAIAGSSVFGHLDQAIEKAYLQLGWTIDSINTGDKPYPCLDDVRRLMKEQLNNTTLSLEIKGNFHSFMDVRLGGLMKRSTGRLFNVPYSTFRPEDWLKYSAIIEMEALSAEATSFLTLLLCTWILEAHRVDPRTDLDIRHVLFIEEAHNIIARSSNQTNTNENVDPKISATAMIVKMLAEVRALKESIIIADQLPSILAPEVIKNTSLKIVHRLTAQEDREYICSSMGASAIQMSELLNYETGDALIHYENLKLPFRARIEQWTFDSADDSRYTPKPTNELAKQLASQPEYAQVVLAFEDKETTRYRLQQLCLEGDTLLNNCIRITVSLSKEMREPAKQMDVSVIKQQITQQTKEYLHTVIRLQQVSAEIETALNGQKAYSDEKWYRHAIERLQIWKEYFSNDYESVKRMITSWVGGITAL